MIEHVTNSYCYRYPHPAVTTDAVIFTISDNKLRLLLIKRGAEPYKDAWAIPGGFLELEEDLDECARRELQEETGLENIYLEQLHAFGTPDRDPRERVITVAYYAIASNVDMQPTAASDASDAAWFPIDQLPKLAFDHDKIIDMAHNRLKFNLDYSAIAFQFLPETFTLSEAQKVYEIIRNSRLDKRNFRKSIINSGLIKETDNMRRNGKHRPARLYRIADDNWLQSINSKQTY
jgi:8-oxo-dGTP diphosphatase